MTEHLNYNALGERELVICWQESWYRIPFYVLKDIMDEWDRQGLSEQVNRLNDWMFINQRTHNNDTAIPEIKEILEEEMPGMEAYLIYDHDTVQSFGTTN